MIAWLCHFMQCDWRHILNYKQHFGGTGEYGIDNGDTGLYQCARCKQISKGCPRYYDEELREE